MQRSESSERTPLVQPTYMFESSVTRQYRKRLRNFQCAVCVTIMVILSVALLVTVGYDLDNHLNPDNTTEPSSPIPETVIPSANITDGSANLTDGSANLTDGSANITDGSANLTDGSANLTAARLTMTLTGRPPDFTPAVKMADAAPDLKPLLNKTWPLTGRPPSPWVGNSTRAAIAAAVSAGEGALRSRRAIESERRPLDKDTPANRAQRAAATSSDVKPMADQAYVAEQATRALTNGSDWSYRSGGVGQGPPISGSMPAPPHCRPAPPCAPSPYRSQDGSCNNLHHPTLWGVAHTPFRRVLPADYGDGISSPREGSGGTLPSARDVSVTVHRPSYAHDSQLTVMLAVWGQFVDHDITATALSKGENSTSLSCCDGSQRAHPECFPVPLAPLDPFYRRYNLSCMEFVRSAPAPQCHFGPREQLNQATAYIDGSTVYGYTAARARRLRSFTGGRLKMLKIEGRELLPPSTDPDDGCNTEEMNAKGRYCFDSGDDRANENLHLTTMHLLWARQHNRIADTLYSANPQWSDERLYQEARRIVGAQMQHIMYTEFLPNVLGSDVMWALNLTVQSYGYSATYDPAVDASMANHFSAAAFRFAHTLLPGLIRSADLSNGSLSYIKLHEMLFNPYTLYSAAGSRRSITGAITTTVHATDPHVTDELSNHLFEQSPTSPTKPQGPCGLDLVSLNIQRGRDHGLPAYPHWREHCGLSRPNNFTDLQGIFDDMSLSRIQQIYSSVDDIDLYTGALAEMPHGRLLGPTLTCLIADQFLRLKIGDRYWYETDDPGTRFTLAQLSEIRKTTLAGVICANEQLLEEVQPRVMEALSAANPLVSCREIPQPGFDAWTQTGQGGKWGK